ncbi:hypothetical protein HYALB_00011020 [Hymenoscyphus albidus]|uniref:AB hydrolase-1 domain-containing protein n=1 Tax=Hymenoscyphus albidus TaxID=595503 RepID=A0A9N9PVJ1_9HELO|nr:hypothetical protein HYALB_00011020 [Hymenoscyphus albidus]
MAHIAYPNNAHSVTVPSGNTYSYAHFPAGSAEEKAFKPTVLLLHGWPSSSHGWIYQIQHLVSLGFGVIAPDLLGYGQTSCPTDPEEYTFTRMGEDLISMLEMVGLRTNNKSIHVVGHDFGSLFLSYLVAKYPSLARSCVFVSVPCTPAGVKVDMDALKPMMEEALGFELFGYRRLLIQPDACSEKLLISNFFPPGALEACLRADRQFPLEPWVTPEFKTTRDRIFQETGYRGSLLWQCGE